jgi:hypothetical protein
MDRNAYKLATSQVGIEDGSIRVGKELISLDEGRDMVQGFLGVRPKYPMDVALKLNEARGYFKQLLDDYHRKRN